jgi:hypothetical protein
MSAIPEIDNEELEAFIADAVQRVFAFFRLPRLNTRAERREYIALWLRMAWLNGRLSALRPVVEAARQPVVTTCSCTTTAHNPGCHGATGSPL